MQKKSRILTFLSKFDLKQLQNFCNNLLIFYGFRFTIFINVVLCHDGPNADYGLVAVARKDEADGEADLASG